jgi:hypothetical protein
MTTNGEKYMDWEDARNDGRDSADVDTFDQNVVVMPLPHAEEWHGVWAIDANDRHEEFEGTEDEVVAWAAARCGTVWV